MNGSSSTTSPLSSLSQSNESFEESLMDLASINSTEFENVQSSDGNSNSLLNETFTGRNESITLLDNERTAVQEELLNILRKANSLEVEIPFHPIYLIEGYNASILIKTNVINPIDKRANASDFPIKVYYQYEDGTDVNGTIYGNDAGLIESVPATAYTILAGTSQTGNQTKDSFLDSYSTSYSRLLWSSRLHGNQRLHNYQNIPKCNG